MKTQKKRGIRKKTMSLKQAKALAKGQKIQKEAMKIMRASGQKTVTRRVYKMTLAQAMKKAAQKLKK